MNYAKEKNPVSQNSSPLAPHMLNSLIHKCAPQKDLLIFKGCHDLFK